MLDSIVQFFCSGNAENSEYLPGVAGLIGADEFHWGLKPDDKVSLVKEFSDNSSQKKRAVSPFFKVQFCITCLSR